MKFEDSDGYWKKYEYDSDGNLIKFEDSNGIPKYNKFEIEFVTK